MKQYAAILLSIWVMLISFFPKADSRYLSDFSTLFKHFQEHQAQEGIDFWQFLRLHYSHTKHQSQDENHRKLPLQHHHAECVSFIVVYPFFEINNSPQKPLHIRNYTDWQSFYHFQLTDENFQPPRC